MDQPVAGAMPGEVHQATETRWLAGPEEWPSISVIIPMYNEALYIEACLEALWAEDYPAGKLDIVVIDGGSADNSAMIVEGYISQGYALKILHNPGRKIPRSLNMGLAASGGEVVVIMGAHSAVRPGFLRLNIENLRRPSVMCSGGTLENAGAGRTQRSIGETMSHPFALATATHRFRHQAGPVRTVAFGAYRREIFDIVGTFEEMGDMAEDAELNWRIVAAGYTIQFDPRIRSTYYPRRDLLALGRQMFHYGLLRSQMLRKHRGGLSALHFVPPAAILTAMGLGLGATFSPAAGLILAGLAGFYALLAGAVALYLWLRGHGLNPLTMLAALVTIHGSWGLGFLAGFLRPKAAWTGSAHPKSL